MTSSSLRRKFVVLLLALTLSTPWALAEERQTSLPNSHSGSLPAPLGFFSELWSALTALWQQSACKLDPFGGCTASPGHDDGGAASGESGCTIDPDGCQH